MARDTSIQAHIAALLHSGARPKQIALELGIRLSRVSYVRKRIGMAAFRRVPAASADLRRAEMIRYKVAGETYRRIGRRFSLSGQRVQQILAVRGAEYLARDTRCEDCGIISPPLHCHHLDYGKGEFLLLCASCHRRRHPAAPNADHRLKDGRPKFEIVGKLLEWRRRWQLTQPAAALALGLTLDTLRNWEQARSRPRGLALESIRAKLQNPPESP